MQSLGFEQHRLSMTFWTPGRLTDSRRLCPPNRWMTSLWLFRDTGLLSAAHCRLMSGCQVVPLICITDMTTSVTCSHSTDSLEDFPSTSHPLRLLSAPRAQSLILSSRVWWKEIMDCVAPQCDGKCRAALSALGVQRAQNPIVSLSPRWKGTLVFISTDTECVTQKDLNRSAVEFSSSGLSHLSYFNITEELSLNNFSQRKTRQGKRGDFRTLFVKLNCNNVANTMSCVRYIVAPYVSWFEFVLFGLFQVRSTK